MCPTFTDQKTPEATCWLTTVRSPNTLGLLGLRLSRLIGIGCRRCVIALWIPQGGHLGIRNNVEIQLGLNSLAVCPKREERTGWLTVQGRNMGVSAPKLLTYFY
ncbi:hypothetical protein EVAR_88524_1 [Eumeta japonica]|uniref:Uncharacterized protein n=1 Tax=Eumeta variegata TaxID=151549 RepID=A0A4C1WLW4_EUMVA|nr:hypothetical protein EVAR_88524_1 [Eumeta japonica]